MPACTWGYMKFETLVMVAFAGLVLTVSVSGQRQGGPPEPQRGAPPATPPVAAATPATPPARPLVPLDANTLAGHPAAFAGEGVTITATVVAQVAPTAFTIGQTGMTGPAQVVLVLAPRLNAAVAQNAVVTVIGDAVTFDPTAVAAKMKEATPQLPADAAEKYRGHAAIIASSVITSGMVDLAKKLPPPVTPDDQTLDKIMKRVGPAFTALRQAMASSNAADATAQATALSGAFTDATAFWKPKPIADANQWTADALHESTTIEAAVAKGDWDAVKASVPKLQQTCGSCHGKYREREDDGTYRLKLSDSLSNSTK